MDISEFLYSRSRYYGQFKPENLVFNSNLQEFATQVSYITNLETNGKISPHTAYEKIHLLWEGLKSSRNQLSIDDSQWENDVR